MFENGGVILTSYENWDDSPKVRAKALYDNRIVDDSGYMLIP